MSAESEVCGPGPPTGGGQEEESPPSPSAVGPVQAQPESPLNKCPLCEKAFKGSPSVLWKHINGAHIAHGVRPPPGFVSQAGRGYCAQCGFAYSLRWEAQAGCRRPLGRGQGTCGGKLAAPAQDQAGGPDEPSNSSGSSPHVLPGRVGPVTHQSPVSGSSACRESVRLGQQAHPPADLALTAVDAAIIVPKSSSGERMPPDAGRCV